MLISPQRKEISSKFKIPQIAWNVSIRYIITIHLYTIQVSYCKQKIDTRYNPDAILSPTYYLPDNISPIPRSRGPFQLLARYGFVSINFNEVDVCDSYVISKTSWRSCTPKIVQIGQELSEISQFLCQKKGPKWALRSLT